MNIKPIVDSERCVNWKITINSIQIIFHLIFTFKWLAKVDSLKPINTNALTLIITLIKTPGFFII